MTDSIYLYLDQAHAPGCRAVLVGHWWDTYRHLRLTPWACVVAGKWSAVVTEIRRMHKAGRPTLVGTTSVERSEALAKLLDAQGAHPRHDRGFVCLEGLVKGVLDALQHSRALLAGLIWGTHLLLKPSRGM